MRRETLHAATVCFIASFCTLVIEIAAGRVLAPFVGVSLYTWTSIIGVVLAGISAGAWLGGLLADRRPVPSTLGRLLLVAGITTAAIAPIAGALAADDGILTMLGIATSLVTRVVVLAFLLFFLPALFLGMISPVAVKLAVSDLDRTGSVVGTIYAVSTAGSIAGTFVTGFWLVARFGTRTTLMAVGVTLLLTAFLLGGLIRGRRRIVAGAVVVIAALGAAAWPRSLAPPYQEPLMAPGETGFLHDEESQYYRIRVERIVRKDNGAPLNALHLDHLIHSYSDPADPSYLHYDYLRIFEAVVQRAEERRRDPRFLFVGGGGYTLPRLIAARNPAAAVDVVEIDPAVTRVARRWFALGNPAQVRSIHQDARWFAMRAAKDPAMQGRYDVIFIDAFNDLSVPYHLTTREATIDLRSLLRPGGSVVANLIDDFEHGRFLASYVKTLRNVFRGAAIVLVEPEDTTAARSTFVPIASDDLPAHLPDDFPLVAGPRLEKWLATSNALLLTDDHAPVDNMLAPLFRDRAVEGE